MVVWITTMALASEVIAERASAFGVVQVVQSQGIRELLLDGARQTAYDPQHPARLTYHYNQLIAAGLCAWSGFGTPGEVLIVGLGGGTLSRHLDARHPELQVTAVEIDPVVVRFGGRYFGLPSDLPIVVADGRAFLQASDTQWDLIVLDAASEDYIPPALMTRDFYGLVNARLSDSGLVVANAWASSPTADDEAATWTSVWDPAYPFTSVANGEENRVLIGGHVNGSWRDLRHQVATRCHGEEAFDIDTLLGGFEVLTPEGGNVFRDVP
jgi:spermidine synthase